MKIRPANLFTMLLALQLPFFCPAETPGRGTLLERRTGDAENTFSFAVIGDNQPAELFGQPAVFRTMLKAINASRADFVVHLGDKIYGSSDPDTKRKQHKEFLSVLELLEIDIRHTPGNHDIRGLKGNEDIYREFYGNLYYSFSHKNSFFIVLNTETAGKEGEIEGNQLEWLKEALEKSRNYNDLFVFMHRPLFSALFRGQSHRHFQSEKHRDEIASLLNVYGATVFAGHEHLYHYGKHGGLHQFISGGGGAPFHFFPAGNFYHYLIVTVEKSHIRIETVPAQK